MFDSQQFTVAEMQLGRYVHTAAKSHSNEAIPPGGETISTDPDAYGV